MPGSNRHPQQSPGAIIGPDDVVLVTGAAGFIGKRVVHTLLARGCRRVRCFVKAAADQARIVEGLGADGDGPALEVCSGQLLSSADCGRATRDASLIYHLAAGRGVKSFPDAYMGSVVTTRNLVEAALDGGSLKRFVNVSSFAIYTNRDKPFRGILDEACPVESQPHLRGDAYCFAKAKQDELVREYGSTRGLPYVLVRPGVVYGPGNENITGRVGIGTFGLFLHLGGGNRLPLTYVENCADAIVLAGLKPGIDGEVFNVVDDDLPTSRQFLRRYKREVKPIKSVFIPRALSYLLCYVWEKYAVWSENQLPPVYSRATWHAYWKGSRYSNDKLKTCLGWTPRVSTPEGLNRFFASCRKRQLHA